MQTRASSLDTIRSPNSAMIMDPPSLPVGEGDSQHQLNHPGSGPFATAPPSNDILVKIINPPGLPELCLKDFESWCFKIISLNAMG